MNSRAAFVLVLVSVFVLLFLFCSPSTLAQESLTLGVPVTGSLSGSGDEVMYSVDVDAGQHLTVVLDATEFNLHKYELYIRYGALPTTTTYDARGGLPDADQAVEVPNTQAGTYYVLVRSYSGGGAYSLVAHTTGTLPTLPVGTARTGVLQGAGDVKLYQVVVPAGEHLAVVLDATEFNLHKYELYIRYGALPTTATYDARGELPDADQAVEVANTQAGTYYALVRSYSGGGDYTIVAHTSSTFPTLALCGPRTGVLQGTGDVKFYQVMVPADEHLTVALDGSPDLHIYELYIRYGALPTTVVYGDKGDGTGADQVVQVAPTQAGTYYLMVRSYSGGGDYVIGVRGFCYRVLLPLVISHR